MGNRKSSPTMMSIAAITSKLQQNINPSESDKQEHKWILAERDINFLVSQTGKYKY